jgi:hypothetical protein
MTEVFAKRLARRSDTPDGDIHRASSLKESGGVGTLPSLDPDVTRGATTPFEPPAEEHSKRVRVQRHVTNIDTLGEIHALEAVDLIYLNDADECMLTSDNAYGPEIIWIVDCYTRQLE